MQTRFIIRNLLFEVALPAIQFLNDLNLLLLSFKRVRSKHGILVETLDNLVVVKNLAIAVVVLE